MRFLFGSMIFLVAWEAATPGEAKKSPSPQAVQFFEAKVRPVLVEHCFKCHGDVKKPKGGLRLDSLGRYSCRRRSRAGPGAGQPAKSLLIKAITYEDKDLKMPPSKKLTRAQIADLTEWVKLGAPCPGRTNRRPPPVRTIARSPTRTAPTGPFGPSSALSCPASRTRGGPPTPSTPLSSRDSRRRDWSRARRRPGWNWSGEFTMTSPACRPRSPRSRRFWRTNRRRLTRS